MQQKKVATKGKLMTDLFKDENPVTAQDILKEASEEILEQNFSEEATANTINIPAPVYAPNEEDDDAIRTLEFNGEDILALITSIDDEGHSPSVITASLENIKNIKEGQTLADVDEENREYVDQINIEYCSVDIDTLDGQLMSVILTFDSPSDVYLRELNEFLNRYKIMCHDFAASDTDSNIPLMSLTFAPKELRGFGFLQCTFPVMYVRCLNDSGTNASMYMMFHIENMEFGKIDITDEQLAELKADVYRQLETGTGGQLFDV